MVQLLQMPDRLSLLQQSMFCIFSWLSEQHSQRCLCKKEVFESHWWALHLHRELIDAWHLEHGRIQRHYAIWQMGGQFHLAVLCQ